MVYAVQEYAEVPRRTAIEETRIFRTYRSLNKAMPGVFPTHQSVDEHISRCCNGINKRRHMKPRNGQPLPPRAYLYVQRVKLHLPVYEKYTSRARSRTCHKELLPTPSLHSHDAEEKQSHIESKSSQD